MSNKQHAQFEVAAKALIRRGNQFLILLHSDGTIDFPGGRIEQDEIKTVWQTILSREISEEAGSSFKVNIGPTIFVSKRYRRLSNGKTHPIAAIFFECQYLEGEVEVSEEHVGYKWVTGDELLSEKFRYVSDDEAAAAKGYLKSVEA